MIFNFLNTIYILNIMEFLAKLTNTNYKIICILYGHLNRCKLHGPSIFSVYGPATNITVRRNSRR